MPKIKTHRGVAKRFRATARGKLVRRGVGHNHMLTKKSSKRKRRLTQAALVALPDLARIRRLLPGS